MDIYLVGGAVRDDLLQLPVKERDWVVVGATPEEMQSLGYRQVGKDFPVYLHPETKEEYALARTERKSGQGHTGFSCNSDPSVTLEDDLSRRDLTINAIARDSDGKLIDPYGGLADLKAGVLRHVSPAFTEDPLRVLRVARFQARFAHLNFTIHESTLALMRDIASSGELELLPNERTWRELEKALVEASPVAFFSSLQASAALAVLMPEIETHSQYWQKLSGMCLDGSNAEIRFAAMLADMPVVEVKSLCARLRPPKRFSELAQLCSEHAAHFEPAAGADAAEWLKLLEATDAFRRAERFADFIQASVLAHPNAGPIGEHLQQARETAAAVDIRSLASEDISGRELGLKLRSMRQEAIQQWLGEHL